MVGGDTATIGPRVSRRRLAAAAVASLLLHLLLARVLAVTSLGLDGRRADATAVPQARPAPRVDFTIRVPKSAAARPAHERPLTISTAPRAAARAPAPRPGATAVQVANADPADRAAATAATAPAVARDRALAAAPPIARAAVRAAPGGDSAAEPAAATGRADAAPSPAPVARDRVEVAAVESRWRPREVALLERLAAPSTSWQKAAADVAGTEAAPGSVGGGRTAVRRMSVAGDVSATADVRDGAGRAAAATADAPPVPAPASARRDRATRSAGAALAGPGRDGGAASAIGEPGSTVGSARGVVPRGVVIDRGDRHADDAAAGPGGATRSPQRVPLVVGTDGVESVAAAATVGVAASGDLAADPGERSDPGPRAVGLAAASTVGRQRLAATLPGGGALEAAETGEAELSVPSPPAGVVDGLRGDDDRLAGARPPERVAAVALPTESRVRDVAEAFARRGRGGRRADPRSARADTVVTRGLEFLARAQQADGRWSLGRFPGSGPADEPRITSDTAATGLALLSFLGAGHDHFDGPHRDTVRSGLEFLLAAQKPDGDLYLPGEDDLSNRCGWLYSHGIASIALCEAVGMTGDPLLRPAAARACGFIAASQHPELGGWRYAPRADADLSVSGWMLVALRSGALAGVETDPRSLAGVRALLDAAARPAAPGRYAYDPRNPAQRADEMSGLCMTAVGGLMRLHTGAAADEPGVAAAARILAARRPAWDARSRDSYLWYCASQVLVHTGGPEWEAWYAALVDTLAARQETAGDRAGSWNPLGSPPDRWGRVGGRIYVTALHLLALEVPDRRLPTYTAGR